MQLGGGYLANGPLRPIVPLVVFILVFDRFSFDGTYRVTAYLQNAAGLRVGSPVTLDGIRIGEVKSIANAQDPRGSIRTLLSINERYRLPKDVTLQVATTGILGDSYLSFVGSGETPKDFLPLDGTAEVKAARGLLDEVTQDALRLLASVNDLLGQDMRDDAKRLVHNAADLAEQGSLAIRDLRQRIASIDEAVAAVRDLANELRTSAQQMGTTLDKGTKDAVAAFERGVDGIDQQAVAVSQRAQRLMDSAEHSMAQLDDMLDQGSQFLATNQDEVRDLARSLRALSVGAERIVADIREGKGVIGQLIVNRELAKDLNDISINLSQASDLIVEHPEALVFGNSTKGLAEITARRERMRLRRAFQEGYYVAPLTKEVPDRTLMESAAEAAEKKARRAQSAPVLPVDPSKTDAPPTAPPAQVEGDR